MKFDGHRLSKAFTISFNALMLVAPSIHAQASAIFNEEGGSIVVKTSADTVRLTACSPTVVHITASPNDKAQSATPQQPWLVEPCTAHKVAVMIPAQPVDPTEQAQQSAPREAVFDTGAIRVVVSMDTGSLQFKDEQDRRLLREDHDSSRIYEPEIVNGESLYRVSNRFTLPATEAIYGLGQHQNGVFNYRGSVIELAQVNTDVAIPLLVSTKGYGFFWNTAAKSLFDNRFPSEMWFSAEASHAIDYYFIYGPEIDQVIHQYRTMTGHAPLFPQWAYGFFQSKDRYKSGDELLHIANEYRTGRAPADVLVQDWFWWVNRGDPQFLPSAYPDIAATLKTLHEEHFHTMLTVWPFFHPESQMFREMSAKGLMIPGTTDYDATNPAAATLYWNSFVGKELALGWDAFWLDASEPETGNDQATQPIPALWDKKLTIGNGALYSNIFPLAHTSNVYRHWRDTTDRKRVFLLTRSAFAGQQRNAAAVWSGDIYSTFHAFGHQIPAGLNFALSGMPYWTTDIGGYSSDGKGRNTNDPSYQELYARWFEFGTFCPIFRTHGHRQNDQNELFSYGPVTPVLVQYDKLRYRLLPYIYSLAWNVTDSDGTIMRPLVMDWRTDQKVWDIGDQFMFGPSLLVSPVTQEGATSRSLYLPEATVWYDFWTGRVTNGGQRLEVQAPLDRLPLYVRAGSILPLGPEIEFATEQPGAAIELRVYPGANGDFDFYEDAGDTYSYEQGQHSVVHIHWDDKTGTLTFSQRLGHFEGMVQSRDFHIVFVKDGHGTGAAPSTSFDRTFTYTGQTISQSAPKP